jgi:MFS family permease
MSRDPVASTFIGWLFVRAALNRGWWLATSLYLVVEADLSAFQLVFLGTAQGIMALAFEVPTGVMADTLSRKWSIVVAHLLMGTGMLVTGLVTAFPALVATQMLWGVAWTFSNGADVAWLTDELEQPERAAGMLAEGARWGQVGGASGMIALGALAWVAGLSTAMVTAGAAMLALGGFVAVRFSERGFTPARRNRWRESRSILRRGVDLARRDREIPLVLAATLLTNGAAEGFGRLYPKQLVELGFPAKPDSIVWFSALGLLTLVLGALALRIVEARIDGAGVARRVYAAACFIGALGLVVLAAAPEVLTGMSGVLIVGGVALTVTRCAGVIWVNKRTTSDVRATVHSFLSQAEYLGEITLGFGLGALAQASTIAAAMLGACALVALTGVLVLRARRAHA